MNTSLFLIVVHDGEKIGFLTVRSDVGNVIFCVSTENEATDIAKKLALENESQTFQVMALAKSEISTA